MLFICFSSQQFVSFYTRNHKRGSRSAQYIFMTCDLSMLIFYIIHLSIYIYILYMYISGFTLTTVGVMLMYVPIYIRVHVYSSAYFL